MHSRQCKQRETILQLHCPAYADCGRSDISCVLYLNAQVPSQLYRLPAYVSLLSTDIAVKIALPLSQDKLCRTQSLYSMACKSQTSAATQRLPVARAQIHRSNLKADRPVMTASAATLKNEAMAPGLRFLGSPVLYPCKLQV